MKQYLSNMWKTLAEPCVQHLTHICGEFCKVWQMFGKIKCLVQFALYVNTLLCLNWQYVSYNYYLLYQGVNVGLTTSVISPTSKIDIGQWLYVEVCLFNDISTSCNTAE